MTAYDVREQYLVENPVNREAFADLKRNAPCRLGIGKAGARCKTLPMLQFQAAHSAAQDAVFPMWIRRFLRNWDYSRCRLNVKARIYF